MTPQSSNLDFVRVLSRPPTPPDIFVIDIFTHFSPALD
jgi:hypothetical protein